MIAVVHYRTCLDVPKLASSSKSYPSSLSSKSYVSVSGFESESETLFLISSVIVFSIIRIYAVGYRNIYCVVTVGILGIIPAAINIVCDQIR